MHKILVTGAGGLIGGDLCRHLYERGYEVVALYRVKPDVNVPWEYVVGDLSNRNFVVELSDLEISCLVHAAAAIPNSKFSFDDCYKINAEIDMNIGHLLKPSIKFIFISTANLYKKSNSKITENSEISLLNRYTLSKWEAEQCFLKKHPSTIILRINAPYAITQRANTVLKIFIENALNDRDLVFAGTGSREQDFTHVSDISIAIEKCIEMDVKGIFNIAYGKHISMLELANLVVSKVVNCKSKIISSGFPDPEEGVLTRFDITKANRELNWFPQIDIESGISNWISNYENRNNI